LYKRLIEPWILNFPTKDHWRGVSRLEDIVTGLEFLEANYHDWGITSLAIPPLGCGYGQLEWRVVGPTLFRKLRTFDIPIEMYAPHGTPPEQLSDEFLSNTGPQLEPFSGNAPRIKPGWIAIVAAIAVIYKLSSELCIGRTTVQKIAYFLTESGVATGLKYTKGSFGPFSRELKPTISKLVNNGLLIEEKRGRMLSLRPGPTYHDAAKAFKEELAPWRETIIRVSKFFANFNTEDAEVAATVHFAAKELGVKGQSNDSVDAIVDEVMRWKHKRKPPLEKAEVAYMASRLLSSGWITGQSESNTVHRPH
jgi:uncharacterized protein YwgA